MTSRDVPTSEDARIYASYVTWWKRAFRELLGWSEDQTLEWAKNREPKDRGGFAYLFHRGPAYYVAHELIPAELRQMGMESVELQQRLMSAIDFPASSDDACDWTAVRRQVDHIIAQHAKSSAGT